MFYLYNEIICHVQYFITFLSIYFPFGNCGKYSTFKGHLQDLNCYVNFPVHINGLEINVLLILDRLSCKSILDL